MPKIAMAREGSQYSRNGISLSWPFGGEREVISLKEVPLDIERAIVEGRIAKVTLPVTKRAAPEATQRLLTGDEARAHKAIPAPPVTRSKFVGGELVQVPVIDIANLPPREEIGVPAVEEGEKGPEPDGEPEGTPEAEA